MNQLTVRGISVELADSIRRLAKSEGISLNQAALRLLRKGAGLTEGSGNENTIGSSLDDLFGTWSRDDAEAFNASLDVFEKVDESAWNEGSARLQCDGDGGRSRFRRPAFRAR